MKTAEAEKKRRHNSPRFVRVALEGLVDLAKRINNLKNATPSEIADDIGARVFPPADERK